MNSSQSLRSLLKAFEFQDTFIDCLGWDRQGGLALLEASGRTFLSRPIAKKGSVTVVEITEQEPPEEQPRLTAAAGRTLRAKIEQQASQRYGVCVLAFINADRNECYWRFPRSDGKGSYPERRYYRDRTNIESLLAVMRHLDIPYELQNEFGEVAHSLMLDKLAASSAQADKVTTKFFKEFADKRKDFEGFLKWVDDEKQRKWYVTALLNRVMFIYFLQERGLLPDKNQYLLNQLAEWQLRGTDRFYRDFLLPLCFFGFGSKQGERGQFEADFKGVPYLDGGLFEVHEVEAKLGITKEAVLAGTLPANVVIPDSEFLRWFQFLGSWRWTLDEDNPENERQINPGILGYIFEKYINQKELGAYYTKEDITGYICRNTIIPRLFDMLAETGSKGKKAVEPLPIGPHPNLLNDGKGISQGEGVDRYIWEAVKTTEYLPTETEREYAARQERYASILQDFEDGKIRTINDGTTYNLNLEKLARDFVLTIQDPEVLWLFYEKCLKQITILDPTVGSGAFLLAAVNILYPLYQAALARMDQLLQSHGEQGSGLVTWKGELSLANEVDTQLTFTDNGPTRVRDDMREETRRIREDHPNAEYFIHKTLIVNNLFGADIVEEAVEICKLRLFLNLVAHARVDHARENSGVEPLPDIDFNIRSGNAIVGYTSFDSMDTLRARVGRFDFRSDRDKLDKTRREYALLLDWYRKHQLGLPCPRPITRNQARQARVQLLPDVNKELWRVHRSAQVLSERCTEEQFLRSHLPLHWYLEFPSAMLNGGFDVVVGNPPWKEVSTLRGQYALIGFESLTAGNLHCVVTERAIELLRTNGQFGFIVQLPLVSSSRMRSVRELLNREFRRVVFTTFDDRPGKLFDGLEHCRATIALAEKRDKREDDTTLLLTSKYNRWKTEERPRLFASLCLNQRSFEAPARAIWKCGSATHTDILHKLFRVKGTLGLKSPTLPRPSFVFYQESAQYWVKASIGLPYYSKNGVQSAPPHGRYLWFDSSFDAKIAFAIINSSLFYFYFVSVSDCFHINHALITQFPVPKEIWGNAELARLGCELQKDLDANGSEMVQQLKTGDIIKQRAYEGSRSKRLMDQIDNLLEEPYGLTGSDSEYVITYDLKYRMGSLSATGEESKH